MVTNQNEVEVRVRYQSSSNQTRQRSGIVNFNQETINWEDSTLAAGPLYNNQTAYTNTLRMVVNNQSGLDSEVEGNIPNQALSYRLFESSQEVDRGLIRYPQLCFVEWQNEEYQHSLLGSQIFGAVSNSNRSLLQNQPSLTRNSMVRIWSFTESSNSRATPSHLPASDLPLSQSYQEYCEDDPRWIE